MDERIGSEGLTQGHAALWWHSWDLNVHLLSLVHHVHGSFTKVQVLWKKERSGTSTPKDQFGGTGIDMPPASRQCLTQPFS